MCELNKTIIFTEGNGNKIIENISSVSLYPLQTCLVMPPPFQEWWRGIKCYPCPCVRPCVRPLSKCGVRSLTFERLYRFNLNLAC